MEEGTLLRRMELTHAMETVGKRTLRRMGTTDPKQLLDGDTNTQLNIGHEYEIYNKKKNATHTKYERALNPRSGVK